MGFRGVVKVAALHNVVGVGPMKEGSRLAPDQPLGTAPVGMTWDEWVELNTAPLGKPEGQKSGGSGGVEQG